MTLNLTTINAAIESLAASQEVDYRIGDKSFKSGQKILQLLAVRKALMEMPDAEIAQMAFDFDVSEFGEDLTTYES